MEQAIPAPMTEQCGPKGMTSFHFFSIARTPSSAIAAP
jgi:hypothetical protein